MFEFNGIEQIEFCASKMYFIGMYYHIEDFVPVMTIYIETANEKMQIESKSHGPNNLIINVKTVKEFSIPTPTTNAHFLITGKDDFPEIVLDYAEPDEIPYLGDANKEIKEEQFLSCSLFSIGVSQPILVINK